MAVIGWLMFGDDIKDAVTSNILTEHAYPKAIRLFIIVCIAIIPITKTPLR